MKLSEIRDIAASQKGRLEGTDIGLEREALAGLPDIETHALIVSGVRRCGKSTLLHQFTRRLDRPFFYLNFDDLRLSPFSVVDYALVDTIIEEVAPRVLFFDEIQSAPDWELYIRQKLDERYQVLITGSNSSLLSRELGTKLTGRHISKELFPFSYGEFLAFKGLTRGLGSLESYLDSGGFPEYLKTGNLEIVSQLQSDILYRDIAVRYGIRDASSLIRLYSFLVSNAAHLVSPSKLVQVAGVKSPSTVLEYFSRFETSYLLQLVPRFDWSVKAQSLSPKKLYVSDSAFIRSGSVSFSPDRGALLENFVFCEARRRTTDIFYFSDGTRECDFVVNPHGGSPVCVQVCMALNTENEGREIEGLEAALAFFGISSGYIITADSVDTILRNGRTIRLLPAHSFDFSQFKTGSFTCAN
jgi:Predicted ATPase (AAA+ superfamily)